MNLDVRDTALATVAYTVNLPAAMRGQSTHTQRSYRRWIVRFLADVNQVDRRSICLETLNVRLLVNSLNPALLKTWLGILKAQHMGKNSIGQAKAAIVWLAQHLGDMGLLPYSVAAGLSRARCPRAESGQRPGTWLT